MLPELDAYADVLLLSPGVVTAEMFQSQEDSEVMSKMVEDLDEVGAEFPKSYLSLLLYYVQVRMWCSKVQITALRITIYRAQGCSIKDFWHFHGY